MQWVCVGLRFFFCFFFLFFLLFSFFFFLISFELYDAAALAVVVFFFGVLFCSLLSCFALFVVFILGSVVYKLYKGQTFL